jgi:hypothetical protein
MIRSEILQEKDKTQTRLSEECTSIHDYLPKMSDECPRYIFRQDTQQN